MLSAFTVSNFYLNPSLIALYFPFLANCAAHIKVLGLINSHTLSVCSTMDESCSVFQRVNDDRTRSNVAVYTQFRPGHCFSGPQKDFIARQIKNRDPDLLEVDRTNPDPSPILVTALGISERHKIPLGTVLGWCAKAKKGIKMQPGNMGGAPKKLDEQAEAELVEALARAQRQAKPMEQPAVHDLFKKKAVETKKRSRLPNQVAPHDAPYDQIDIDPKTMAKCKKTNRLFDVVTQGLTNARHAACTCIRLVYVVAIVIESLGRYLSAPYKWNMDCTSLLVQSLGTGMKVTIVRNSELMLSPKITQTEGACANAELNLIVKAAMLGNAGGEIANPAFIYSIPGMSENEFFTALVPGLSASSEIGAAGRIYFCKTRGGNASMWRHFFINHVITAMSRSADFHGHKVGICS